VRAVVPEAALWRWPESGYGPLGMVRQMSRRGSSAAMISLSRVHRSQLRRLAPRNRAPGTGAAGSPAHAHPRHSALHSPTRATSETTAQIASAGASMMISASHIRRTGHHPASRARHYARGAACHLPGPTVDPRRSGSVTDPRRGRTNADRRAAGTNSTSSSRLCESDQGHESVTQAAVGREPSIRRRAHLTRQDMLPRASPAVAVRPASMLCPCRSRRSATASST